MRFILFLTVLIAIGINCVSAKNNVKALTESMGHEIIEIGAPLKGLPSDLEEEPSAEVEEDEKTITTTNLAVATKKDTKKNPTTTTDRRKLKDFNKLDDDSKQDDEEERIEKELAEIYKDNIDYKADSAEVVKEKINVEEEKPIARTRGFFKFQPDMSNQAEVEKFRTSVDEISCDKRATKLSYAVTPQGNSAIPITAGYVFAIFTSFTTVVLSCRIL